MARRFLGRKGATQLIQKATARAVPPLELLEQRQLLSATSTTVHTSVELIPAASSSSAISGYTPAQIRNAYGFSTVSFSGATGDGSGQTIAIVDAYNDPNIKSDLTVFDRQFGLAAPPNFSVVSQTGSSKLPATDAGWAQETSLDVEWAHAIAPQAKILLVETTTDSTSNLIKGVNYARSAAGVSVVSMSWGTSEFSGQTAYDKYFTTPAGHTGVTFVSAAGDEGADGGAEWPASSPNVLAVGGTTLTLDSSGNISSESTWSDTSGGTSTIESTPAYQSALGVTGRTTADVSYNADPNTGFATYDSLSYQGEVGWAETGGTSAGTPQWAALVAIADQGRTLKGSSTLDGATGTLPAIYNVYASSTQYASDFNDITTGSDGSTFGGGGGGGYGGGGGWDGGGWGHGHGGGGGGGHGRGGYPFDASVTAARTSSTATASAVSTTSAATGYDVPTGVGTPKAAGLIASLVSSGSKKASTAIAVAKVAKSSKIHRAIENEATPVVVINPTVIVSRSPDSHASVPAIDSSRFQIPASVQSAPANSSATASNIDGTVISTGDSLTPSLAGYLLDVDVNFGRSLGRALSRSVIAQAGAAASSLTAAFAAEAKVAVTQLAITTATATASELFSVTHIDATATFADAMSNFADECAAIPSIPVTQEHSTARAWALTGMIVAVDAAILVRHRNKRRVSAAANHRV